MTHAAAAHHTSMGLDSRKMAFWAFIGSECLLFGSLISTYLIYKGKSVVGPYPHDILNIPFTSVSTFDLLMSSLMMVLALAAVQRGDLKWAKIWLFATAFLGILFLGGQVYEFTSFVREGLTLQTNLFGCTFFVLTGTHGAHVTVGVLWLSAVKFALGVLFYMHLRMDSRFFSFLFGGPFLLAVVVLVALLFLFFGHFTLRGAAGGGGAGG